MIDFKWVELELRLMGETLRAIHIQHFPVVSLTIPGAKVCCECAVLYPCPTAELIMEYVIQRNEREGAEGDSTATAKAVDLREARDRIVEANRVLDGD
jgi:hypothetical protein